MGGGNLASYEISFLLHIREIKACMRLRMCAVMPEPSLYIYTDYNNPPCRVEISILTRDEACRVPGYIPTLRMKYLYPT